MAVNFLQSSLWGPKLLVHVKNTLFNMLQQYILTNETNWSIDGKWIIEAIKENDPGQWNDKADWLKFTL